MLGEATLDVSGTFAGEAIRLPIQIAALQKEALEGNVRLRILRRPTELAHREGHGNGLSACRPLALVHPAEAAHDGSAGLRGRVTPGTPDSACFIRRDQARASRPMPTVRTHSEGRSPEQGKNAAGAMTS